MADYGPFPVMRVTSKFVVAYPIPGQQVQTDYVFSTDISNVSKGTVIAGDPSNSGFGLPVTNPSLGIPGTSYGNITLNSRDSASGSITEWGPPSMPFGYNFSLPRLQNLDQLSCPITYTGAGDIFVQSATRYAPLSADISGTLQLPILALTNNGAGLIRVQVASHSFTTGDAVNIGGTAFNSGANGTWPITVISGTLFDLDGSVWIGDHGAAGVVIPRQRYVTARDKGGAEPAGVVQFDADGEAFSSSALKLLPIAAPASIPGAFLIYMDVADNKLKAIGPSATVTVLANP